MKSRKSRTKTRAVAIGGLLLLLLATTTASARTLPMEIDAADFGPGTAIDNQYWPLIAGTIHVYYAESADGFRATGGIRALQLLQDGVYFARIHLILHDFRQMPYSQNESRNIL